MTVGIHVAEEITGGERIARADTATVAFIGRTLRGPVNQPVILHSFSDYQSVFGGLWQPTPLSYAMEHFFENGGVRACVVRVINGGRAATLTLPTQQAKPLQLEALCPGTSEFLRAAVDYDNVPLADEMSFNLVVQRVRAPGHEHIEDQEIYTRASADPSSPRYLGFLMADSALVRLKTSPGARPVVTVRSDGHGVAAYVSSNPDGDDGAPLTEYDVIGSATEGTGLFAFGAETPFNFLYVPPLSRDQAVGPGIRLLAARVCRNRRAMLIVDPPREWASPEDAAEGMRHMDLVTDDALMYFPWIQAYDRLRASFQPFAPGAAAAGMLSRLEAECPFWVAGEAEDAPLRPGLRPTCAVSEDWRERLAQAGLNTFTTVRARRPLAARTLAGLRTPTSAWRHLSAKRLALFVMSSIERGTRWVVFEQAGPALSQRVHAQVVDFLGALAADGAFFQTTDAPTWVAVCDERLQRADEPQAVHVLFGFAAERADDWHCWVLTQEATGSRINPVGFDRVKSILAQPRRLSGAPDASVLEGRLSA